MSLSSLTLLLLASTAPVPATSPAEAPAAESAPAEAEGQAQTSTSTDPDIVVTARRREERAQDVPIAMAVVGGAELTQTGAFNVNRLQQTQPTLQFYSSNPRNSAINIRGLGAPFGLTNDGIEQGVGFYLDGVYVGRAGASTFDFVDVDRVEVLRGPQGTLYGKNTTAGAINVTTKAPSFTPQARFEISGGNYTFVQVKASASGPLIDDVLAVRVSATRTSRHGTIDNVASGDDLHRQRNFSGRALLLWRPPPISI